LQAIDEFEAGAGLRASTRGLGAAYQVYALLAHLITVVIGSFVVSCQLRLLFMYIQIMFR